MAGTMQVISQDGGKAATQFRPGRSGNPSGRTNMLERTRDLCAMFEATHGRPPSPLDMIGIRTAARLAAAAASPRTNAEQAVRAGNTLHKTLKRLGLASPPARRDPKPAAGHVPLRDRLGDSNGHKP
jgi:hypothetical protein